MRDQDEATAMDERNWASDRPLDDAIVRAVLAEQFPELATGDLERLGSGWDSEVFLVDGVWVLRFPKRAPVQAWLATEQAFLPHLAPRIEIAVPRFELFGKPCEHFPYTFVGYRLLPGVPVQLCLDRPFSAAGRERMARQLGEALGVLHALDAGALGVELRPPEPDDAPRREAELQQGLEALLAIDAELHAAVARALDATPRPPAPPGPAAVPVHADLDVEHILVDPDAERITAFIDWGDVQLGPAVGDAMGAQLFGGEPFSRRVLAHHPHDFGEDATRWLRRCAFERALGNVTYGSMGGPPSYLAAGLHGLRTVLADLG